MEDKMTEKEKAKPQKKWAQEAMAKIPEGALHRQLGINPEKNIPRNALQKVVDTEIGETINIPSGKKNVKVTRELKQRANAVLNITKPK